MSAAITSTTAARTSTQVRPMTIFGDARLYPLLTARTLREIAAAVKLKKENLSGRDAKSLLLWMAHKEDMFDRMWYQWFDCVYSCIPKELEDTVWTGLFRKHFSEVIRAWSDSPPQTPIDEGTAL
jgi:hypothetical protein